MALATMTLCVANGGVEQIDGKFQWASPVVEQPEAQQSGILRTRDDFEFQQRPQSIASGVSKIGYSKPSAAEPVSQKTSPFRTLETFYPPHNNYILTQNVFLVQVH